MIKTVIKTPVILLAFHIFFLFCGFFYLQSVDKSTAFIISSEVHIFEPALHFVLLALLLIFTSMEDQINPNNLKAKQRLFLLGGLTVCSTILPKQLIDLIPIFYVCLVYTPIALLFFKFPFFTQEKPFVLEALQFAGMSFLGALFLFGFTYFPLLFIPFATIAFYIKQFRIGIVTLSALTVITSAYYYIMFFLTTRFLSQPTTALMALVGLFVMESYVISNRYFADRQEFFSTDTFQENA